MTDNICQESLKRLTTITETKTYSSDNISTRYVTLYHMYYKPKGYIFLSYIYNTKIPYHVKHIFYEHVYKYIAVYSYFQY